jgi:hypothetical protein
MLGETNGRIGNIMSSITIKYFYNIGSMMKTFIHELGHFFGFEHEYNQISCSSDQLNYYPLTAKKHEDDLQQRIYPKCQLSKILHRNNSQHYLTSIDNYTHISINRYKSLCNYYNISNTICQYNHNKYIRTWGKWMSDERNIFNIATKRRYCEGSNDLYKDCIGAYLIITTYNSTTTKKYPLTNICHTKYTNQNNKIDAISCDDLSVKRHIKSLYYNSTSITDTNSTLSSEYPCREVCRIHVQNYSYSNYTSTTTCFFADVYNAGTSCTADNGISGKCIEGTCIINDG